jgi:hypothetical protein
MHVYMNIYMYRERGKIYYFYAKILQPLHFREHAFNLRKNSLFSLNIERNFLIF